jgi:Xaa-Pro aminopeptidase
MSIPIKDLRELFRSEYNDLPNTAAFDPLLQARAAEVLKRLRSRVVELGLDAYLISSSDQFSNEYPPYPDLALYQLFSFDGSAGVPGGGFRAFAAVTASELYLIVDGRYIEEAQQICDRIGIKAILHESPDWKELLMASKEWKDVGLDKDIFLGGDWSYLNELINETAQHIPTSTFTSNIVNKPPVRKYFIFEDIPNKRIDLLDYILDSLDDTSAWYLTFSEDISIMFGIKGNQNDISPFAPCRCYIEKGMINIFIPDGTDTIIDVNGIAKINCSFVKFSAEDACLAEAASRIAKLYVDFSICPMYKVDFLKGHFSVVEDKKNPITFKKLVKTPAQIQSAYESHNIDNIAVARFLLRLQTDTTLHGRSEVELADLLEHYRSQHYNYIGRSFPWAIAIDENSSLPHYKPRRGNPKLWGANNLILIDTGAQFPAATTDATRVLHSSSDPEPELKQSYTIVLKGHIALSRSVFPEGISGHCLDLIARQPLYSNKMDFRHGTGHGVGVFASVHEGIARISPYARDVGLVEGLLLTNEPGFYVERKFGIRIENTLVVKRMGYCDAYGRNLLGFNCLTYLPYAPNLIERGMLDNTEKKWLLDYYTNIVGMLSDFEEKSLILDHIAFLRGDN